MTQEDKKYTIDQYEQMCLKFNKMTFSEKIKTLLKEPKLFRLASDGNCWRVKVLDAEIFEQLEDKGIYFYIEPEWGTSEICDLVYLLGLKNDDY